MSNGSGRGLSTVQTVLIGLVVGAVAGAGTWWLLGGAAGGAASAGMEGAPGAGGGPPGGYGAAPVDVVAAVETVAAEQCGYGDNISQFRESLKRAGEELGIEIERLSDLIDTDRLQQRTGESIAPDSMSDL